MSASELQARLLAERAGEPFLVLRDGEDHQVLHLLGDSDQVAIGRRPTCDLVLDWDDQVSRLHARLERVDQDWTVVDDGFSSNGTFVNGERIHGRRRLADGDTVTFGTTPVTFRSPVPQPEAGTVLAAENPTIVRLSDAQKRVLLALCRPYRDGSAFASPATNGQIAEELFLSIDAVKTHLRVLFAKFGIEQLPQNQKRARLVERAFQSGAISVRDL